MNEFCPDHGETMKMMGAVVANQTTLFKKIDDLGVELEKITSRFEKCIEHLESRDDRRVIKNFMLWIAMAAFGCIITLAVEHFWIDYIGKGGG